MANYYSAYMNDSTTRPGDIWETDGYLNLILSTDKISFISIKIFDGENRNPMIPEFEIPPTSGFTGGSIGINSINRFRYDRIRQYRKLGTVSNFIYNRVVQTITDKFLGLIFYDGSQYVYDKPARIRSLTENEYKRVCGMHNISKTKLTPLNKPMVIDEEEPEPATAESTNDDNFESTNERRLEAIKATMKVDGQKFIDLSVYKTDSAIPDKGAEFFKNNLFSLADVYFLAEQKTTAIVERFDVDDMTAKHLRWAAKKYLNIRRDTFRRKKGVTYEKYDLSLNDFINKLDGVTSFEEGLALKKSFVKAVEEKKVRQNMHFMASLNKKISLYNAPYVVFKRDESEIEEFIAGIKHPTVHKYTAEIYELCKRLDPYYVKANMDKDYLKYAEIPNDDKFRIKELYKRGQRELPSVDDILGMNTIEVMTTYMCSYNQAKALINKRIVAERFGHLSGKKE